MTQGKTDSKVDMKGLVSKALKIIVPLCVSAGLVIWLFHKVNVHQVVAVIKQGVNYWFIAAMMLLTVLSHIIRGVRWGYQLRAAGIPRIPWLAESVSIFGAYALNLLFPYIGEAWRCVYVERREGCKLSTVVGTDLGDRASDGVMISMLIVLAAFVAQKPMERFMTHYQMGRYIDRVAHSGEMWLWVAGVVLVLGVAGYLFRHTKFMQGVKASAMRMWDGFSVLFHMKGRGMYVLLTFGIWICYFLETYLCFFAFPFTRELIDLPGSCYGLIPGLVVFVFGSCSMAVPSNGGLGAWNIAVMFALSLYGISAADGAAYSLVFWSFQTMIQIASGVFSAFYIMHSRREGLVPNRKLDKNSVAG